MLAEIEYASTMLDALEGSDGSTELLAHLQIIDRGVQHASCVAVGAHEDGRAALKGHGASRLARSELPHLPT